MELLREREGMKVYREGAKVIKEATDGENLKGLQNAIRFHKRLSNSRYVPHAVLIDNKLIMEYVEPVKDIPLGEPIEQIRRETVYMLDDFRKAGVIHGDLTAPNIIITQSDNLYYPVAIDWDQSNFCSEVRPQKRPKPDPVHVWPAIVEKATDPSRVIRRYMAMREHIEYYLPFGSFIDFGTHQGDFPAMLAVEGMWGVGVDSGQIRPDCLDRASELWNKRFGDRPITWFATNIVEYVNHLDYFDVGIMFSTWAYLVHDFGLEQAKDTLKKIIQLSKVFFFEHQLYGDGPGFESIREDEDIFKLLFELAPGRTIQDIVTIPVVGRNAHRTVWKVE